MKSPISPILSILRPRQGGARWEARGGARTPDGASPPLVPTLPRGNALSWTLRRPTPPAEYCPDDAVSEPTHRHNNLCASTLCVIARPYAPAWGRPIGRSRVPLLLAWWVARVCQQSVPTAPL